MIYPTFRGKVTHGTGEGKKIKVPTANLEIEPEILKNIPFGVYASITKIDEKLFKSITHIGPRLVFSEDIPQFEVHIFDLNKDIYGELIEVDLKEYIRESRKFDSLEKMMDQIELDIIKAKEILQSYQL